MEFRELSLGLGKRPDGAPSARGSGQGCLGALREPVSVAAGPENVHRDHYPEGPNIGQSDVPAEPRGHRRLDVRRHRDPDDCVHARREGGLLYRYRRIDVPDQIVQFGHRRLESRMVLLDPRRMLRNQPAEQRHDDNEQRHADLFVALSRPGRSIGCSTLDGRSRALNIPNGLYVLIFRSIPPRSSLPARTASRGRRRR